MSRQLTARHSHRAWVSRGKLHVWGGCIVGQSSKFHMKQHGKEVQELTQIVEVFDVNGAREWISITTKGEDRPLGIRDAALALLGSDDSRAVFFGGYCGHGAACFHNSLHELDTNSWEWKLLIPDTCEPNSSLAPMMKRNSGAVGYTRYGKDYVCVFAGNGLRGSSQFQKNARYESEAKKAIDCVTNELHCAEVTPHKAEWFWPQATGSVPPSCAEISFIKTSDMKVVMVGGHENSTLLNGVYQLNLENWEWSKVQLSPDVLRRRHFSTLLVPGKVITMGGADENQETRSNTYIIDVETGSSEMVLEDPKVCHREWHSISAIPGNEVGTSVLVAAIGGVTIRDERTCPTTWPKVETNYILEFNLTKSQDGFEQKWKLTQTKEFHEFFSRQDYWEFKQSELTFSSDHVYLRLKQDLDSMKRRVSRLEAKHERMKLRSSHLEDEQDDTGQHLERVQDDLHQKCSLLTERCDSLEQKHLYMKNEQDGMNERMGDLQQSVASFRPASNVGKKISSPESRIVELEEQVQQLHRASSEKDILIEKYKTEYKEQTVDKQSKLKQELASAKFQLEEKEKAEVKFHSEKTELKMSLEDCAGKLEALKKLSSTQGAEVHKLQEIVGEQRKLEQELMSVKFQLEEKGKAEKKFHSEKTELKMSLDDYTRKLEAMKKISNAQGSEIHKLQDENRTLNEEVKMKDVKLQHLLVKQKGDEMPFSPVPTDTCDAIVQADYLALTIESLQGVEVCGQTLLEITGSKQQKVSWVGHGFHLTIPEGAVPSGVTVSVAVKAILAGRFELPEDTQLVSAIYWVCASETFLKKVSVHIQHCASITSQEEASNYKMIVGKCSQECLPYTFQIRDGIFSPESQLATISTKQFSFFAAVFRGLWGSKSYYMSYCYLKCHPDRPTSWKLRFMITQQLPACLKEVEKKHKDWEEHHQPTEIEFELKERTTAGRGRAQKFRRREPSILLEVTPAGKNEPKVWDIYHINLLEISQQSVDRANVNVHSFDIPTCELGIDWKDQYVTDLPVLRRRVNLVGAKAPKFFTLRICPPTASDSNISSAVPPLTSTSMATSETLPDGCLDEHDLQRVLTEIKAVNQVQSLGLALGILISALDEIQKDFMTVNEQRIQIIKHWLKRARIIRHLQACPPTWSQLADAVAHEDFLLSERIRSKYCNK